MKYKKVLITGGAGFVGSNIALKLKKNNPTSSIIVLDNLTRKGSTLNLSRLKASNIKFIKGDIRKTEDIGLATDFDLIIDCAGESSVSAGYCGSPRSIIENNLIGTINCLEQAHKYNADFVFLSTSRVYPTKRLNSLKLIEEESRFSLGREQPLIGVSARGVSEEFSLAGTRTFYGATKLSSELILQEYIDGYGMKGFINRCGVLAGPWQMGQVDQGFMSLWVAKHFYESKLSYIGYGGEGKQVRDVLHIDDLYNLLELQLEDIEKHNGQIYNVGGGIKNSVSLKELTHLCQMITKNKISIEAVTQTVNTDIPYYVTDFLKVNKSTGWKPNHDLSDIVEDIYDWLVNNKENLKYIFNPEMISEARECLKG